MALLLYTGMRRGELLALRWKDIDLKNGTIKIQNALTKAEKGHKIGDAKVKRSRKILISSELEPYLKNADKGDIVITNKLGNALDSHSFYVVSTTERYTHINDTDKKLSIAKLSYTDDNIGSNNDAEPLKLTVP